MTGRSNTKVTVRVDSSDALAVSLGRENCRFGSSVTCDYLLSGVEAPVVLSLAGQPGGRFLVEAHEPIVLDGVALAPGDVRTHLRAASISYKGVDVVVQSARRRFPKAITIASLSIVALAAPLALGQGFTASFAPNRLLGNRASVADNLHPVNASAVSASPTRSALDSMRAYAAMLGYSVRLHKDGRGRYHVSGRVLPEQRPLLKEALGGLRPKDEFVWALTGEGTVPAALAAAPAPALQTSPPPSINIVSVLLRPRPTVTTANGQRLSTGSRFKGDWTVTEIGFEYVVLKNGDRTHRVEF